MTRPKNGVARIAVSSALAPFSKAIITASVSPLTKPLARVARRAQTSAGLPKKAIAKSTR